MLYRTLILMLFLYCNNYRNDLLNVNHSDNGCSVILISTSVNKSFNVCNLIKESKVKSLLGNPISIKREQNTDVSGEKPWVQLKYKGLLLSIEGDFISELAIETKGWKLNELEIGMPLSNVTSHYSKINRTYKNKYVFSIPKFDGVLIIGVDINKNINFIGLSSS